jgi:hypothetical protein
MSHIETRRIGDDWFVLFVAGPDDRRRWLWWINRVDACSGDVSFGTIIAQGGAGSRGEAVRALEHAFNEEEMQRVRQAVS